MMFLTTDILSLTLCLICQMFAVLMLDVDAQSVVSPITSRPTNGPRVPTGTGRDRPLHDRSPETPFTTVAPAPQIVPTPVSLSPTLPYTHPPNPRRAPHPNKRGPVKNAPPPTPPPSLQPTSPPTHGPTLPPTTPPSICTNSCPTAAPIVPGTYDVNMSCLTSAAFYIKCGSGFGVNPTNWFRFQAPSNCAASVSTTVTSGAFNANIALFNGGGCTPGICTTLTSGTDYQNLPLDWAATLGTFYTIVVIPSNAILSGTYTLTLSCN
jgi:hypothetical protein